VIWKKGKGKLQELLIIKESWRCMMANARLSNELAFQKDWIWDPPSELFKQFEFRDLMRLAVTQLKAQHAMLKVQEEAVEEAIEIYSRYVK
jgi:hypothetical protein